MTEPKADMSQAARALLVEMRSAGLEIPGLRVWEGMWHVFEFYPIPEAGSRAINH